jgi:hypothetical protein
VKVTTALRPGVAVELEMLRDVSPALVRLPDLTKFSEEEVRLAHLHVLRVAFLVDGPERTDINRQVIGPLEAELRRRGLEIDYASMDRVQHRDPVIDAGREAERPDDDMPMVSPRPSELRNLDEAGLRRANARVMRAVFNANGLRRMGLGAGVLTPIEVEMRRRGLEADYWSMEHKLRSDAAFRAELN